MPCEHTTAPRCTLCEWLLGGRIGPIPKTAIVILNQESNRPEKESKRSCPKCGGNEKSLVSREMVTMCVACAEALDEQEGD